MGQSYKDFLALGQIKQTCPKARKQCANTRFFFGGGLYIFLTPSELLRVPEVWFSVGRTFS